MASKNQLGKFKRPEELVWGPASLLRAICEHTVGDLSSVNSRHLYLLPKKTFFLLPVILFLGLSSIFLSSLQEEKMLFVNALSLEVSVSFDIMAGMPACHLFGDSNIFKHFSKHNQNCFFIILGEICCWFYWIYILHLLAKFDIQPSSNSLILKFYTWYDLIISIKWKFKIQ